MTFNHNCRMVNTLQFAIIKNLELFQYDKTLMKKLKLSIIAFVVIITFTNFLSIESLHNVRITPMTNEYFERIYKINTLNQINYLHISCKEKNILSISVTPTLDFHQHPRYPVFDQFNHEKRMSHQAIPRMQKNMYTFLYSCPVDVLVSQGRQLQDSKPLITVKRRGSEEGSVIFSLNKIQQQSNYTKIFTFDPSIKFGMGQRFQKNFAIKDGTWSVYNRDRPWEIDEGKPDKSKQTYGHQPVYLARNRKDDLHHMIYFKNTFPFNYESKMNSQQMTYHSIGGNVHFLIFIGDKNPEKLIRHYHEYIGGIHIPPFWSLGWHQSRWGYRSLETMKQVIRNYNKENIPIDILWSDLDYMHEKAIFTIDSVNYPPEQFRNFLKQQNLHWIPLIDVGVSVKDEQGIIQGKQLDVFMKQKNNPNQAYIGKVWPGLVHFVDYLHPNASRYWQSQLNRLYSLVPFSGIWLDMNEPSNFDGNRPIQETYKIQHSQSINMMTIDNDLPHYCYQTQKCSQLNNIRHFFQHKEVHAYYGHFSTIPTFNFLQKHGRPFIISRSNSVGTGRFAGHWTGDNVADWDFLRLSISGNFLFQIFGIQMVGADVCGFHKNTNEDLCSRWMQVGSLYPFARSHNQNQSTSQQPYILGQTVKRTSYFVLRDRYSLLKQIYTEMVVLNGTGSLYRPLFFQFFQDNDLIKNQEAMETQFLIGKYLMSAPIVQSHANQRTVYFPGQGEVWYDITKIEKSPSKSLQQSLKPFKYTGKASASIKNQLPAPVPMFLRGGGMIFSNEPQLRTKNIANSFIIIAALQQKTYSAQGTILGIQDYHEENNVKLCILQGCHFDFKIQTQSEDLRNSDKDTLIFVLQWKGEHAKSAITIQGIRVFYQNKQWRFKQKLIVEKSGTKSINLQLQKD